MYLLIKICRKKPYNAKVIRNACIIIIKNYTIAPRKVAFATVCKVFPCNPTEDFMEKNQTVSAVNPFVCRRYSDKRQITFRHRASIITAISYHTKKFVSTFICTNLQILSKIFMLLLFAVFFKRVKNADNRLIGGDLKKMRCVFAVDGKKISDEECNPYRKNFSKSY